MCPTCQTLGVIPLLFGAASITAGILIIRNREKVAHSNAERQKRYLGKMGRDAVEAGMSTPGFAGLTGVGFIVIGVGQLVIAIFNFA
jgi:hypothetical protein